MSASDLELDDSIPGLIFRQEDLLKRLRTRVLEWNSALAQAMDDVERGEAAMLAGVQETMRSTAAAQALEMLHACDRIAALEAPIVVRKTLTSDTNGIVRVVFDRPMLVTEIASPTILDAPGRAVISSATETRLADGRTSAVSFTLVELVSQPAVRTTVSLVGVVVGAAIGKTEPIIKPAANVSVRVRIVGTA